MLELTDKVDSIQCGTLLLSGVGNYTISHQQIIWNYNTFKIGSPALLKARNFQHKISFISNSKQIHKYLAQETAQVCVGYPLAPLKLHWGEPSWKFPAFHTLMELS